MIYFVANGTARTGKGADVLQEVKQLADASGMKYEFFLTEHEVNA